MIIRPSSDFPIRKAEGNEFDLLIFHLYQTRQDYATDHGQEPPPPDPNLRRKHWYDPKHSGVKEDDGQVASYIVVQRDPKTNKVVLGPQNKPVVTQLVIPTWIAGRVNIGTGITNEFDDSAPFMRLAPYPCPIRPLHEDEYLAAPSSPFGDYRVVNLAMKEREAESQPGFQPSDRAMLKRILELLERG